MLKTSKTDWERLALLNDQNIDTRDILELDADFFRRATVRVPVKQPVPTGLNADVQEGSKRQ